MLVVAGCGTEPQPKQKVQPKAADAAAGLPDPSGPPVLQQAEPAVPAAAEATMTWARQDNALRLTGPGRTPLMVIACRPGSNVLMVHVPDFTPIGSEDRLSLGLGQEPVTLVADLTRGQGNGGIHAEGQVPDNFETLLTSAKRITAVYGSQQVGPFPAVPTAQGTSFARGC